MSSALATVGTGGQLAAARGGRPKIMAAALAEEGEQRKLLGQYITQHMIEGTDFGTIPGAGDRKVLLKPGAEKLTDLFRCVPEYELVERVEDWDRPLIHYLFRCRIISRDTGAVVAEGFGSCNSRESKYRWRNDQRKCPACGKPTIVKTKKGRNPGGYWCVPDKGGCGASYDPGDPDVEGQAVGKVENPDVADCANTILKMAKKRAQVDAVISLARCSDMFTQDVEDFDDAADERAGQPPRQQRPAQPAEPPPEAALFAELSQAVAAAQTLDALKAAFEKVNAAKARLTRKQLDTLTTMKDRRKADLEKAAAGDRPAPQAADAAAVKEAEDLLLDCAELYGQGEADEYRRAVAPDGLGALDPKALQRVRDELRRWKDKGEVPASAAAGAAA